MDLSYAIHHCRAMRRLKPDPVPEDLIWKLLDAAHHAPSGSNRQNARWVVVRDPEQKKKLAELNRTAVKNYIGDIDRYKGQYDAKHRRLLEAVQWQADYMQEIPVLIIACLEISPGHPDKFVAGTAAGGSIWPAVQNLLLTARELELGAAPTTLGLSDRPAAKAVLDLPDNIEPFCIVPVGYPRGRFGPVTRRPLEEVVRWDRWSE